MLSVPLAPTISQGSSMFSGQIRSCLLLFFILAGCLSQALSQPQVHIVPRKDPEVPTSQRDSERVPGPPTSIRISVNLALIPVTVVDALNHPVTTLEKQNFLLYDNGEQQTIQHFSREDAPISVGILLDLSFSMKDKIDIARQALSRFFESSNPEDDYFVIGFSNQPVLISDASRSIASIEDRLTFAVPQGNTALLDAIYMGLERLQNAHYSRRALLIISDGGDNHSRYSKNEIRRIVQEADVEIYALGIFSKVFKTYEEWAGKRLLTEITESTGGHTVSIDNVQELPEAAANISRELRNQYVLGYSPNHNDNRWRKLKVQVVSPSPGVVLHVYSKGGYLALPH